ncbi:hypothetical protein WISP_35034 [Willisornis vidua]|uniref:Uncharacterized protein n=1 Tax=Willisornis vidua TaxID=1566151 RepID=A0ABQ9DIV6_9PASS|nr:hypothetical protein WISP_35034 [Willisornis vidua]
MGRLCRGIWTGWIDGLTMDEVQQGQVIEAIPPCPGTTVPDEEFFSSFFVGVPSDTGRVTEELESLRKREDSKG